MEETTMKNILKLGRKFALLAAMLCALGVLTFSDTGTAKCGAAPCCSECETRYQDCIDWGGTHEECRNWEFSCWRWCDFDC
jgi:hypothetical protein